MAKFALDIDGVLADTEMALKEKIQERHGITPDSYEHSGMYHNMYQFKDDQDLEAAVRETIDYYFHFDPEGYVYKHAGVMVENAFVAKWRHRDLVAYITRRPEMFRQVTQNWLDRHGLPKRPLIHVERGTCKSTKMKELGVDIIVEDSPYEINSCVAGGAKVIIIEHPYNKNETFQGVLNGNAIIARSWSELDNLLRQWPEPIEYIKVESKINAPSS